MPDSQTLFDALAGAAGHPVDRPGINAAVANSQAINGLRSAQTETALLNASKAQEEQAFRGKLEDAFTQQTGDPVAGKSLAVAVRSGAADWKSAFLGAQEAQNLKNTQTLSDPAQLNTPAQTAAQQGLKHEVAGPVKVDPNYAVPAGVNDPAVKESPLGAAQAANLNANAGLHNAQAAVGGFNPHAAGGGLNLPDAETGALGRAINEGRLDPTRINSRNAHILASAEMNNPGMNFNRLHADAALQSNSTFQQRAMTLDALPQIISNVRDAGKKIDFSDIRRIGDMQGWMRGEVNDPEMTDYMTQRNDALMTIAGVMRGVGMSDKAHQAEIEAMHPTLSGPALDAWFHAQSTALEPRLKQAHRVTGLGGAAPTTATTPQNPAVPAPGATPVAPAGATPVSLDDYLKSHGH